MKTNTDGDPIGKLIPRPYMDLIARAIGAQKLALTLVISDGVMRQLNHGQAGLVPFPDGGVIVLLTEQMLVDAFSDERNRP